MKFAALLSVGLQVNKTSRSSISNAAVQSSYLHRKVPSREVLPSLQSSSLSAHLRDGMGCSFPPLYHPRVSIVSNVVKLLCIMTNCKTFYLAILPYIARHFYNEHRVHLFVVYSVSNKVEIFRWAI